MNGGVTEACRVTRLKYVRQIGADPGSVLKSRRREGDTGRPGSFLGSIHLHSLAFVGLEARGR